MLKHSSLFIAVSSLLFSFTVFSNVKTDKVAVNTENSKIIYVGSKAITKDKHTGEIKIKEGFLNFEGDSLKGGEFIIDMLTVTNTDIMDAEYNKKFITHITGEDFFNVEKYKTSKLTIKEAKKEAGNKYKITADLTIKEKTHPVTFSAEVTKKMANATLVIDRTAHDIKYGSGKFFKNLGDKVISDNIDFTVNLTLK